MEVAAMILFLAGLVMSEVTAVLGVILIFQGLRYGTISHEMGMLGMSGCFCYLVITISWLYMKLINQE